jgi:hypothetical protein
MIVFTHRPSPGGWEFDSDVGSLNGACRTLEGSLGNSEHAARHYLSRRQGYDVLPEDARYEIDHVIRAMSPSSG